MAEFVVCMRPPGGGPVEYMPKGFGFTAHAHTLDRSKAETWPTVERARQAGDGYRRPPAFWNSEREHRDAMERKFRGWSFTFEPR